LADFEVLRCQGAARRGRLTTGHGVVETPAFMPVGTLGAVKGLGPEALEEAGAQIMLANLYHLVLRPGVEVIAGLGGVHAFCGWRRPLLTDSGGFQVFSLSSMRQVDRGGVTFRSIHDGALVRLTPESVLEAQARLGVDIAMVLDECPPWPIGVAEARAALERTQHWIERAAEWRAAGAQRSPEAVFGIVQGSFFDELRGAAVEHIRQFPFDGFAIGGVSVGEGPGLGRRMIAAVASKLPAERPRYLMGLGTPADIALAVGCGVDLFDCVLPSRNARHGFLFTRQGAVRIKNAQYRNDPRPLDEDCGCPACRRLSRGFLHHLFHSGELTAKVLATAHNIRFYLDFMGRLREALEFGSFEATASELIGAYRSATD
jgi:queuine tRNA-ribosyltransferase